MSQDQTNPLPIDSLVRTTRGRRRARWNPQLVAGTTIIAILVIGVFVVPLISSFEPLRANPREALEGPSLSHPFGTDRSGLDIFVRSFVAAKLDLTVVFAGVAIGAILGIGLGVAAGFSRGILGDLAMRLADVIQAFPLLILAITLVALAGNSLLNVVIALAFVNVPLFLRLTRGQVLSIREQRFVMAAVALGNPTPRLLVRHILPNSLGPATVQFGVSMGYGILTMAGLAFLGVGVQVPTPEWGAMILTGSANITTGQWWTWLFPGLMLILAVFAFNLLSEGIESAREVRRS